VCIYNNGLIFLSTWNETCSLFRYDSAATRMLSVASVAYTVSSGTLNSTILLYHTIVVASVTKLQNTHRLAAVNWKPLR